MLSSRNLNNGGLIPQTLSLWAFQMDFGRDLDLETTNFTDHTIALRCVALHCFAWAVAAGAITLRK
jgi:hypothetical protein